ncbi:MAG: hypothetical protein ABI679_11735 [Gemmatimonadota bacterium]
MNWDFLGFLATMVSIGVAITIPFGMFTLYRALGRRFDRRIGADPGELEILKERLAAIEDTLRQAGETQIGPRVHDLEERMDFAERLLTDRESVHRIEGGQ